MRILITGANGYIGKTLHNALRDKHYVVTVTRNSFDLTDAVAMSKFFASKHHFDVVLHCAGVGGSRLKEDSWDVMDDNLTMYYNLLQFRKHYTRLIHFGSGAETYAPREPYGYSKKVIAKSILGQNNFYNIKIFGVFDENELETRFIKANIKKYIAKETMEVHQNGIMDFFYIQDLIKVVEYYINTEEPVKEFDCAYSAHITLLQIAENIINCLDDYKVNVEVLKTGSKLYASQYRDPLPINFVGLEEGIRITYNKLKNESN